MGLFRALSPLQTSARQAFGLLFVQLIVFLGLGTGLGFSKGLVMFAWDYKLRCSGSGIVCIRF